VPRDGRGRRTPRLLATHQNPHRQHSIAHHIPGVESHTATLRTWRIASRAHLRPDLGVLRGALARGGVGHLGRRLLSSRGCWHPVCAHTGVGNRSQHLPSTRAARPRPARPHAPSPPEHPAEQACAPAGRLPAPDADTRRAERERGRGVCACLGSWGAAAARGRAACGRPVHLRESGAERERGCGRAQRGGSSSRACAACSALR